MHVKELRNLIGDIQDICDAAGAAKMADDLSDLVRLFDGHEEESVDDFLDHLREVYAPRAPVKRNTAPIDRAIVDAYVKRLREAGSDPAAFRIVTKDLSADRLVGKGEANAIQFTYIGGREAWPSKKAALEAIEKWFSSSRFQQDVLDDIKRVTPW